ncbi:hypothetical protein EVAR_72798_1 [Eumeta japonica]|uniref:Uncharacterized protein n=1 Tax=Eumeta variegata TaxID=151549 RepID=A0A4C1SR75_EUMVA|nr:hypothetical protein EVAR_72798_1 [Eumeta japonica]
MKLLFLLLATLAVNILAKRESNSDRDLPAPRILLINHSNNSILRVQSYDEGEEDDQDIVEEAASISEENSPNLLPAGLKVRNSYTTKGKRVPARFNIILRGGKRDQVNAVSQPVKYREYLQNGQPHNLQANKDSQYLGRRRVIRRRKNHRRNNKSKNNKSRRFLTV